MIDRLPMIFFWLAALTVASMAILFVVKVIRHRRIRQDGLRRAVYIAALGEVASHGTPSESNIAGWANDPSFAATLVDFLNLVDGAERSRLVDLADHSGLTARLAADLTGGRTVNPRLDAVSALSAIGSPSSLPALRAALADPIEEVRLEAAAGLARIGEAEDVEAVLRAMEHEDTWTAERMADALVDFGTTAVQALSNYVLLAGPAIDPVPRHLPLVIRALGLIGDPSAEVALLTALRGEDPILRIKAASALGEPWNSRVTRALIRALSDPDWRVRSRAAAVLGDHRDPGALPALRAALRDEAWWVRQHAAESLSEIEGGTDVLFAALEDSDPFAVDAALARLMAIGAVEGATDDPRLRPVADRLDPTPYANGEAS